MDSTLSPRRAVESRVCQSRSECLLTSDSTQSARSEEGGDAGDVRIEDEAQLVLAFSCHRPSSGGLSVSLAGTDELVIGRGPMRLVIPRGRRTGVMVDDHEMSRQHAALRRIMGGWVADDLGSKNGTLVNGDPIRRTALEDGDVIEVGSSLFVFRGPGAEGPTVSTMPCDRDGDVLAGHRPVFQTLVPGLEQRFRRLVRIAPSQVPVLVRGETGTGKELVARAIHELSGRRGEFVAINCGALPQPLIEGQLFGYLRGAFTGATADRPGFVRAAHGGTLFLDEIGDLPTAAQTALLRVLQERAVVPLGATHPVDVDIRVVAATHRPLELMVRQGEFRRDLHARLAGFELTLPPLRERREDLGILMAAVLGRLGDEAVSVTIHRAAARALVGYLYPANIRELEQALRSAVLLARGRQIRMEHLPEAIQRYQWPTAEGLSLEDQAVRERLLRSLLETRGNVAETARALDKAPMQVRRWIRRFDIDLSSFRAHGQGPRVPARLGRP